MPRLMIILTIIVLLTNVLNADDDWTQKFPTSKPSGCALHAMAYIAEGKSILFGG